MGILNSKKTKRGAVSKRPKPSRRRLNMEFNIQLPWRAMRMATAVALLLGLVAGAHQLFSQIGGYPVDRVAVTGVVEHVDRQALIAEVKPLLTQGFIAADLEAIRQQLERQPWIYQVRVERRWPRDLAIEIREQAAIAYWGEDGLLNHRGDIFVPNSVRGLAELPKLHGPQGSSELVMANYRTFSEILAQQGLQLLSLGMNARGNWQAELAGDIRIVLGSDQIMDKMQRFVRVYRQVLAGRVAELKRIDMRYGNGMAVAWKEQQS